MKLMKKQLAALLVLCCLLAGCKGQNVEVSTEGATADATAEVTTETKIDVSQLTEDYYEAVNGNLLATKEIPADSSEWNYFNELMEDTDKKLKGILKEMKDNRAEAENGSIEQKIVDFHECVLDKESRKKAGLGDLAGYLEFIQSADTVQEYVEVLADIEREIGFYSLIYFEGMADMADSTKYAWYLGTADLGPGKETFEDENQNALMKQYRIYIAGLMEFSGLEHAETEKVAEDIFTFQKDLASAALPLSESGNPDKIYNPYTTKELQELFSNIDIVPVLKKAGVAERGSYIVTDVKFQKKVNEYLKEEHLPILKNYSSFCLLNDFSKYLTPDIEQVFLEWRRAERGLKEDRSEEKRAYDRVDDVFGFEMGRLYVDRYFSEEDKAAVETMIGAIIDVYETRIWNLDWMSEETKKAAIRKLDTMTLKIGYPDKWPDYYKNGKVIPVSENGCLINNIINLSKASSAATLEKFSGDTIDKDNWEMTPQMINAYYNPLANEIVFPAGILQAPFYSTEASEEENLGGIGTAIAHEISHAFDNNGSLYDENGNYSDWWTEQDKKAFEKRSEAVVEYYNGYEGLPGRTVNGKQTLGENIADLAGVSCVTEVALKNCDIEAMTDSDRQRLQTLYQNYAIIWANKNTEEDKINRLNIDVHSPAKVRVNAVLSSTDGFYLAYPELKEGNGMYLAPEKRVKVW